MTSIATPDEVLAFWRAAGPQKWFTKDAAFDAELVARFLETYNAAAAGHLAGWEATPEGALALTIVLDQFPRNMFRNSARAYDADPLARAISRRARARGDDRRVPQEERTFFYLPLMHSESLADQDECLALYQALGHEEGIRYAQLHADIIRRFGRFPHRNGAVGRATTTDEQSFLDGGGFAG